MDGKLFDPVIIGFDGSGQSQDALALGALLGSLCRCAMVAAYVGARQPPFERQSRVYAQSRRDRVSHVLEPALAALAHHDEVEQASIDSSSPARGLHDLAAEYDGTSLLVIGSTHRGPVGRVVLGSVGENLVSGGPCPLAVAPSGYAESGTTSMGEVVVGFDGSRESHAAVQA